MATVPEAARRNGGKEMTEAEAKTVQVGDALYSWEESSEKVSKLRVVEVFPSTRGVPISFKVLVYGKGREYVSRKECERTVVAAWRETIRRVAGRMLEAQKIINGQKELLGKLQDELNALKRNAPMERRRGNE